MKSIKSIFLFIIINGHAGLTCTEAVITVPITEASLKRLGTSSVDDVSVCYYSFPISPDKGDIGFLRVHQFLYNQAVNCIEELDNGQMVIEVPGLFYIDWHTNKKCNHFLVLKKDLIATELLHDDLKAYIPAPIDYTKPILAYSKDILTLTKPWHHEATDQTYSAGTRFVRYIDEDTDVSYAVWVLDYHEQKAYCAHIPLDRAVLHNETFKKAQKCFVAVLRDWAHQPGGMIIPYVFGGCSHTGPMVEKGFKQVEGTMCDLKGTYWERTGATQGPLSGFDCSGCILAAAQIAWLPYYFKNTTTLACYLHSLKQEDQIEEGDLILYRGHTLIISDVINSLIIETIGYGAGYGRMHELPVSKIFSGIKDLEHLKRAHLAKDAVRTLNSNGEHCGSERKITILKLRSIVTIE